MILHTYSLSITNSWGKVDDILTEYISPLRNEKIREYRFAEDQKLSLYSALLIRMLAIQSSGFCNEQLSFSYIKHCKPIIKNISNFHFNISHTKGRILCAVSSSSVGADIEKNVTRQLFLSENIFTPEEIEYIKSFPSSFEKNIRFYEVWTKKEAILKYYGIGLFDELSSIDTFDLKYQDNLKTWHEDQYVCSIYSNLNIKNSHTIITEDEIQYFFLTYIKF